MGKLVQQRSVKWDGDLFNLFMFPNQFSQIIPHKIQSVDLLAGRWGTAGSVICWTYNQDGRKCVAKEIIEAIDEKKKSITFKVIEGDLLNCYNAFKITVGVESNGNGNGEEKMVTWSLEYEKKNEAVAEPTAFMDFLNDYIKDVERTRQLIPN